MQILKRMFLKQQASIHHGEFFNGVIPIKLGPPKKWNETSWKLWAFRGPDTIVWTLWGISR